MSAQLSQHVTTRLLIAEKSENSAHELDSSLRDAGVATKLSISDDLAHIAQIVSQGEADLVLLTDKLDGLDTLLPRIRANAPHIPLILLTHDEQEGSEPCWSVANALNLGATDAVPADQREQLALVVKRELDHVCQREHFSQVRRALKEAEQRCQLLLQGSRAAIAYVHEGMHIHANEGYLDLFGYNDVDDLCGASLVDIISADSADELKIHLKALRGGAEEATFDFISQGDEPISGTMTLANSQYEGEDCLQVTVRTEKSAPSTDAAGGDTNGTSAPVISSELELPGFVKAAEALFGAEADNAYMLVVALDHHHTQQQAYGLVGTESICRKVWQHLAEVAQDSPITRISNHETAIAIIADNYDDAVARAESLRESVGELMFEVQEKTVRPTVAIAGAAYDAEIGVSKSLDAAYSNLLDHLETENNNSVFIPSAEPEEEENDWNNAAIIMRQITDAIEKKNFLLLFQPVISLRGDSDEHYEVFLRMTDAEGEQIEPGKFLQTAIDNNVAGKIDRWVILQSIKMLSVHRAKGHATRLTVNLTCNSIADPEFLQWLTVAIKAARLPSDAVIFQVTEKDATTYLRQTREFIEGLRNMHCRASLSRFGLIEDPFETLRHLPVDMVKLDGSIVDGVEGDADQRSALIEKIQKLQGSGKLTIVPMVENANILSTLWQAGANYIQGHYLQEPSTDMDYDFSTEE